MVITVICGILYCFTEYGLTEASTGISVGSQPPLVIPSTQPGDMTPYQSPLFQQIPNSIHVPLMRAYSTPSAGSSPRSTKKRLSLASSETASSVDSSSSSGVYDLNLHATDEEASVRSSTSTPLEEKLSNAVKRSKQRKLSREISPLVHSNIVDRLDEENTESKEKLCDKPRSASMEETSQSKDKYDTPGEDRKGNTFIKTVSFLSKLSEKERSRSTEDTVPGESPVFRRNIKDEDMNNTVPRRRSLIERISMKSHIDNITKRRNSLDMPTPKNGRDSGETDESKLQNPRKVSGQSTEVRSADK